MAKTIIGFLSLAAMAVLCVAPAQADESSSKQQARLTQGPYLQPDRVVVMKSERRMALMHGDYVIRVYNIALGRYPQGHKMREGDARTPEGSYTLDYKLENSAFYKAIRISYPNPQDIARAEAAGVDPGGRIMIHGLPNNRTAEYVGHPRIDWTQGCIAVTNKEMDELWEVIALGTPIDIYP